MTSCPHTLLTLLELDGREHGCAGPSLQVANISKFTKCNSQVGSLHLAHRCKPGNLHLRPVLGITIWQVFLSCVATINSATGTGPHDLPNNNMEYDIWQSHITLQAQQMIIGNLHISPVKANDPKACEIRSCHSRQARLFDGRCWLGCGEAGTLLSPFCHALLSHPPVTLSLSH